MHKLVICTQSSFFSKACDGEFKVRRAVPTPFCEVRTDGTKEAKDAKIDLADDGVYIVSTLLHYLYHFDFDDAHHVKHGVDPVVLNMRVLMASDKYFITPLRNLAMQKLRARIATDWDKAVFGEAITMAYSE